MADIIFTGRLTKERLKALYQEHYGVNGGNHVEEIKKMEQQSKVNLDGEWNPYENHQIVTLKRGGDGNWTAIGWFQEQMKKARTNDPQTALVYLITGQGEPLG